MAKHPVHHLTARQDFGPYKKGQHIDDKEEVERILNSEHRSHVIRVAADADDEGLIPDAGDIEAKARS